MHSFTHHPEMDPPNIVGKINYQDGTSAEVILIDDDAAENHGKLIRRYKDRNGDVTNTTIAQFAKGPKHESGNMEKDGATIEELAMGLIARLREFNAKKFGCRQNSEAATCFETGLLWLSQRTSQRVEDGTKNKLEK